MGVRAGCAIVTQRRPHGTLVHVQFALRAHECCWTQARVLVHSVHACRSVLAEVTDAVVDIFFAMLSSETCKQIFKSSL